METLYFITGNPNKFSEARELMPELEKLDIDLPEIQSLDPQEVVAEKLKAAKAHHKGRLIVEDTSLYLEGLNGFPGPLIKWMLHAVGDKGIYDLTLGINNRRASAKTIIGYHDGSDEIQFFEGSVDGQIVAPYGNEGFGWDAIFQPNGLNETFAEMGTEFKPEFSMRTQAFVKLRDYLEKQN